MISLPTSRGSSRDFSGQDSTHPPVAEHSQRYMQSNARSLRSIINQTKRSILKNKAIFNFSFLQTPNPNERSDEEADTGDDADHPALLTEEEYTRPTPPPLPLPPSGSLGDRELVPPTLRLSLVSSRHSLWGHRLWNAALLLAGEKEQRVQSKSTAAMTHNVTPDCTYVRKVCSRTTYLQPSPGF